MRKVLGIGLILVGGYLVYKFFVSSAGEAVGGRSIGQPLSPSPERYFQHPGAQKAQYERLLTLFEKSGKRIPPALLQAMKEVKEPIKEG